MRRNHRRIKSSRIRTIKFCPRTVTKDSEGVPNVSYGTAYEKQAEVWPAGGRLQVEMYGDRTTDMINLRVQGQYEVSMQGKAYGILFDDGNQLTLGDGICVDSETPDYAVRSITPYHPVRIEAERI